MTYREALETYTKGPRPSTSPKTAAESAVASDIAAAAQVAGNTNEITTPIDNPVLAAGNRSAHRPPCLPIPGTLLRISIPSGTTVNFFNLIEATSPGGISFIVRLPFLSGFALDAFKKSPFLGMMDAIRAAGGTIELVS